MTDHNLRSWCDQKYIACVSQYFVSSIELGGRRKLLIYCGDFLKKWHVCVVGVIQCMPYRHKILICGLLCVCMSGLNQRSFYGRYQ